MQSPSSFVATTDPASLARALAADATPDAAERVCTVNENNVPTPNGHTRAQMRRERLWHRATYVVVRHEDGGGSAGDEDQQFLLAQRRTNIKDYCPGKLDPAPGGKPEPARARHSGTTQHWVLMRYVPVWAWIHT